MTIPYDPVQRRLVREAAKRQHASQARRLAVVSTALFFGLIVVGVGTSKGWPEVQRLFFSPYHLAASFPAILNGFWLDVRLFLVVEVFVLIVGLTVAVVRSSRAPALLPLRLLATAYTDIFRGLPTILVVYLVGFGIPALRFDFLPRDVVVLGGVALTLSYGAYVAEVFRAGIASVHPSQRAAARALGLTHAQAMRFVVLPQAIRRVVPPLLNDFVSLTKDVALVSILGPLEAYREAQIYASSKFNYTPLFGAAALYLLITIPLARVTDRLQADAERARSAGGAV